MSPRYAVLCKPRREALAEANLINQGYRVYLPRLATQHRRDGKWVDTVEPLFPRYLFIAAGREQQGFASVRSTLGVSTLVRFGGQPATVPEAVVEALRGRQDPGTGACARRNPFQTGQAVEFRAGPFAGLDAYKTRFEQSELRAESAALPNGEAFVTILATLPTPAMQELARALEGEFDELGRSVHIDIRRADN